MKFVIKSLQGKKKNDVSVFCVYNYYASLLVLNKASVVAFS